MADEAHLAVLKQGADVWNRWRAAHPDIRPDLSNAILRGLDLVKVDLCRADLANRRPGLESCLWRPDSSYSRPIVRGVALKGRTLDNLFRDTTPHEKEPSRRPRDL